MDVFFGDDDPRAYPAFSCSLDGRCTQGVLRCVERNAARVRPLQAGSSKKDVESVWTNGQAEA